MYSGMVYFHTFHLSATMAGLLFNNNDNKTDEEFLNQLSKSWFTQNCSTPAMVIGAKNESVVSQAFSKLSFIRSIFEVGLLLNKTYPWMAASPDGVVVAGFEPDENVVASIEMNTRVYTERIQQAEEIAAKYQHKHIVCEIGDETWKECIEEEHLTQNTSVTTVMGHETSISIFTLLLHQAAVLPMERLPTLLWVT